MLVLYEANRLRIHLEVEVCLAYSRTKYKTFCSALSGHEDIPMLAPGRGFKSSGDAHLFSCSYAGQVAEPEKFFNYFSQCELTFHSYIASNPANWEY